MDSREGQLYEAAPLQRSDSSNSLEVQVGSRPPPPPRSRDAAEEVCLPLMLAPGENLPRAGLDRTGSVEPGSGPAAAEVSWRSRRRAETTFLSLPVPAAAAVLIVHVVALAFCIACSGWAPEECSLPNGGMLPVDGYVATSDVKLWEKQNIISQCVTLLSSFIYVVGASTGMRYSMTVHTVPMYLLCEMFSCATYAAELFHLCSGNLVQYEIFDSLAFVATAFSYAYTLWLIKIKMQKLPAPRHWTGQIQPWSDGAMLGFFVYWGCLVVGTISVVVDMYDRHMHAMLMMLPTVFTMLSLSGVLWAIGQTVAVWIRSHHRSNCARMSFVKRMLRTRQVFSYMKVAFLFFPLVGSLCLQTEIATESESDSGYWTGLLCFLLVARVGSQCFVALLSGTIDLFLRQMAPELAATLRLGDGSDVEMVLAVAVLDARTQIEFLGRILPADAGEVRCVASFPGTCPEGFSQVVEGNMGMSAACVFTTNPENGFGQHATDPDHPQGKCYCHSLYGHRSHRQFGYLLTMGKNPTPEERQRILAYAKAMKAVVVNEDASPEEKFRKDEQARRSWERHGRTAAWGCAWFARWTENVHLAVARKQKLVVCFFEGQKGLGKAEWSMLADQSTNPWDGVGLGGSQKVEVAWLDRMRRERGEGYRYEEEDLGEFLSEHGGMSERMAESEMSKWDNCIFALALLVISVLPFLATGLMFLI